MPLVDHARLMAMSDEDFLAECLEEGGALYNAVRSQNEHQVEWAKLDGFPDVPSYLEHTAEVCERDGSYRSLTLARAIRLGAITGIPPK